MLENHREKTSFHSPRTDTCNIDAAPKTADFDFNRFELNQD
jgi:hypothetical protein